MDKTIYGQSKVMGFDHKVINLVGVIIYLKIYWCELKLLNLFREGLKNYPIICVTTTVEQSGVVVSRVSYFITYFRKRGGVPR